MHVYHKLIIGCCSLFLLQGCMNTTKQMTVVPTTTNEKSFTRIQQTENKASFALAKIINDIDRGDAIFAFPAQTKTKGMLCNYMVSGDATVTYGGGKQYLGDWSSELGEIFYESFVKLGYNVAGSPDDLFNQNSSVGSAEYLVGARLLKTSGNFCHEHHWWDGRPLYKYSGEMSVQLEWSILNTLTKEVVIKEKTRGYNKVDAPIKDGIATVFNNAFADAATSFAKNEKVRKLATGEQIKAVTNEVEVKASINQGEEPNGFAIENIKPSIATIRVGMGHGSGFFVGKNGLIITNAHVVGDASMVQIITTTGLEITGDVVFKNKARDVALVKTPIKTQNSLNLRLDLPNSAEEVFAVGTPLNESLQATVTKGIVSAIRKDATNGLAFIQSDAAISPGNSGGPLFDSKGRVVGISVAKFSGSSAEGLGLFIPIKDALESLGVSIKN